MRVALAPNERPLTVDAGAGMERGDGDGVLGIRIQPHAAKERTGELVILCLLKLS